MCTGLGDSQDMAKGRSHSRSRDDFSIANLEFDQSLRSTWLSRPLLDPVTDLRVYNPTTQLLGPLEISRPSPSQTWISRPARVSYSQFSFGLKPSFRTDRFGNRGFVNNRQRSVAVFQAPKRVAVCVRRQRRKEVLFARGKVGRGYRKPKWNERSYMRCR